MTDEHGHSWRLGQRRFDDAPDMMPDPNAKSLRTVGRLFDHERKEHLQLLRDNDNPTAHYIRDHNTGLLRRVIKLG